MTRLNLEQRRALLARISEIPDHDTRMEVLDMLREQSRIASQESHALALEDLAHDRELLAAYLTWWEASQAEIAKRDRENDEARRELEATKEKLPRNLNPIKPNRPN